MAPKRETSMRILIAEDDQVLADGLLRSLGQSIASPPDLARWRKAALKLLWSRPTLR